jgi:hypothetical protein
MSLISTFPRTGLPGVIVNTKPHYAETVIRSASSSSTKVITIDLNPIAGAILPNAQYSFVINGTAVTHTYQDTGGSAVQSLASQLAAVISRYGFFWGSIQATGVIRLTARLSGTDDQVVLGTGLTGATLTVVTPAVTPLPMTAGTLLFYDNSSPSSPDGSRSVSTYNLMSVVGGFNALRDVAGIVVRSESNYGQSDSVPGDYFEVLRQGIIWCRNYGTTPVNRTTQVRINNLAPSTVLPAGAFGTGLDISTASLTVRELAYTGYAIAGDMVPVRINLN